MVAEAYVCAGSRGYPYNKPDPRAGHYLLSIESTSEQECHRQIDQLIVELQQLKRKASRWFKRHEKTT
jgi:hypothetical protein